METIDRLIRLCCVLGVVWPLWVQATSLPPKNKFYLFLLIGQSNMAGRGVIEPHDQRAHPQVLALNQSDQWVPASDPIHFDKPIAGVGPGRSFGFQIVKVRPDVTVGLIPCAVGGTTIDQWLPHPGDTGTETRLWSEAVRRARVAQEFGVLQGILWHQGESDATSDRANVYYEKLVSLVSCLRSEFSNPDLPFIVGELGQFGDNSKNRDVINQALRELPIHVKNTAFVSSINLTDQGDQLHFDANSSRELGKRYALAYLKLSGEK